MPDSHGRLVTTFYCFKFETPQTWRARSSYLYLPGTGWPSYTPRIRVPFSSPLATRRTTVEVFDSASTREIACLPYNPILHGPSRKHLFQSTPINACVSVAAGTCLPSRCLEPNVVSEPFASNVCFSGSTVLALSNMPQCVKNRIR
jgi:hypothetical protein